MTPNRTLRRFTLSSLALAVAALLPAAANASTAANTTITNTASVAYNDEGGVPQTAVTAQASITVTLVTASPLLVRAGDVSVIQSQNVALTYTLTGTANGPDTYRVTAGAAMSQMQAVASPVLPADFILGGTTLAADATAGSPTILVPYDGVAANTSLNGLAPGDGIVVGGNVYTIAANGIVKNAGANTATITLTAAITGANVLAGSIVGEQATFVVSINSGLVAGTFASGTHSITATVTSTTSGSATVTQGTATVVTVTRPMLTVTKSVSTDGGATFGATANAAPGTSLVYKIVVTNGGASNANAVVISDQLPRFLTYVGGSGKVGTSAAALYTDGGLTNLTDNAGGYTVAAPNLSYAAAAALSTTPGSDVLVLFYRATID
jgi:uncharacterized repeat protein (TIGR01451 family)